MAVKYDTLDSLTGKSAYQPVSAYPFGGDISEADQFAPVGPTEPEQEYKPHPQKTYTSTITMKAPANFKPIPLEQNVAPKPAPPAVPPKPFKDTSVFQNVDLHAVEVRIYSMSPDLHIWKL